MPAPGGGLVPGGCLLPVGSDPGGVPAQGGLVQGVPASGGVPGEDPPDGLLLRAVRILLECILV